MTESEVKMETVDIIASGYEWTCPECNRLNKEIEYTQQVQCKQCQQTFETGLPEHAIQ